MKLNKTKFDLLTRSIGKHWLWVQVALGFAFLYLPIVILIIYSFNASRSNAVWRGFTLDWYRSLFASAGVIVLGSAQGAANISDAGLWEALNNSLLIASISTFIATIFGTMIALALERFRFPGRRTLETLLFFL